MSSKPTISDLVWDIAAEMLSLAVAVAVFWLIWTVFGIGKTYFYYLPEVFQEIPFLDCYWLSLVVLLLKDLITPRTISKNRN